MARVDVYWDKGGKHILSGRQECLLHFLVAFKITHLSFTAMQVMHEYSAFLWAFHHFGHTICPKIESAIQRAGR